MLKMRPRVERLLLIKIPSFSVGKLGWLTGLTGLLEVCSLYYFVALRDGAAVFVALLTFVVRLTGGGLFYVAGLLKAAFASSGESTRLSDPARSTILRRLCLSFPPRSALLILIWKTWCDLDEWAFHPFWPNIRLLADNLISSRNSWTSFSSLQV